jgi:hypothetical protein
MVAPEELIKKSRLNDINQEDIESISVLKKASVALFMEQVLQMV